MSAPNMFTVVKTVRLKTLDIPEGEHQMEGAERLISLVETEGFDFHSLTFVGVLPDGSMRFVVAFRRRTHPDATQSAKHPQ